MAVRPERALQGLPARASGCRWTASSVESGAGRAPLRTYPRRLRPSPRASGSALPAAHGQVAEPLADQVHRGVERAWRPTCAAPGARARRTGPSGRRRAGGSRRRLTTAPARAAARRARPSSSSAAILAMVRESVVEGSKRFWRVKVVKSARRILTCTQPAARFCARMRWLARSARRSTSACMLRVIGEIAEEGFLGADRLLVPLGHHRAVRRCRRRARACVASRGRRSATARRPARRAAAPSVASPAASTRSPSLRPRPGRRRTESGSSTRAHVAGVDHREPVGLLQVGGDLRHQLVRRDADRGGELRGRADALLDAARDA